MSIESAISELAFAFFFKKKKKARRPFLEGPGNSTACKAVLFSLKIGVSKLYIFVGIYGLVLDITPRNPTLIGLSIA